jgi:hypothetical protein
MTLRGLKEYAQAEGAWARFGVDSELVSDLSYRIRVSETAKYWEKFQHTFGRPHVDQARIGLARTWCVLTCDNKEHAPRVWFPLTSVVLSLTFLRP